MSEDMLLGLVDQAADDIDQVAPGADEALEENPGEDLDDETGEPDTHYRDVYAFVAEFLAAVYARPVGAQITDFCWCPRWWEHAEAVSRLEALWKAFETLRQDPGLGAGIWWRDYADPTMGALSAPDGPFARCGTTHRVPADLPLEDPPAWFRSGECDGASTPPATPPPRTG